MSPLRHFMPIEKRPTQPTGNPPGRRGSVYERALLWSVPVVLAVLCFLLSYCQPFGPSRDYTVYDTYWNWLRGSGLALATRFEPGFTYASWGLAQLLSSNQGLYGVLAGASIFLKTRALGALAPTAHSFLVGTVFYVFRFAPLHELTQIRASLALAILFVAFTARAAARWNVTVALCCIALLFHMSSALIILFLPIVVRRRRYVMLCAAGVFAAVRFLLPWAVEALSPHIPILAFYETADFTTPNPFSIVLLLDAGVIVAGFVLWRRHTDPMKQILLLQCVGLAFYWATLSHPVFAHRLREALASFWAFYIALLFAAGGASRVVAFGFTLASSVGHIYLYFFNPNEPYFS